MKTEKVLVFHHTLGKLWVSVGSVACRSFCLILAQKDVLVTITARNLEFFVVLVLLKCAELFHVTPKCGLIVFQRGKKKKNLPFFFFFTRSKNKCRYFVLVTGHDGVSCYNCTTKHADRFLYLLCIFMTDWYIVQNTYNVLLENYLLKVLFDKVEKKKEKAIQPVLQLLEHK